MSSYHFSALKCQCWYFFFFRVGNGIFEKQYIIFVIYPFVWPVLVNDWPIVLRHIKLSKLFIMTKIISACYQCRCCFQQSCFYQFYQRWGSRISKNAIRIKNYKLVYTSSKLKMLLAILSNSSLIIEYKWHAVSLYLILGVLISDSFPPQISILKSERSMIATPSEGHWVLLQFANLSISNDKAVCLFLFSVSRITWWDIRSDAISIWSRVLPIIYNQVL